MQSGRLVDGYGEIVPPFPLKPPNLPLAGYSGLILAWLYWLGGQKEEKVWSVTSLLCSENPFMMHLAKYSWGRGIYALILIWVTQISA